MKSRGRNIQATVSGIWECKENFIQQFAGDALQRPTTPGVLFIEKIAIALLWVDASDIG
jgi:hypothetical protein